MLRPLLFASPLTKTAGKRSPSKNMDDADDGEEVTIAVVTADGEAGEVIRNVDAGSEAASNGVSIWTGCNEVELVLTMVEVTAVTADVVNNM